MLGQPLEARVFRQNAPNHRVVPLAAGLLVRRHRSAVKDAAPPGAPERTALDRPADGRKALAAPDPRWVQTWSPMSICLFFSSSMAASFPHPGKGDLGNRKRGCTGNRDARCV